MKSVLLAAAFGAIALAGAADACKRSVPARASQIVIPAKQIDQNLFDHAVRAEVNFHRCRAGVAQLSEGNPNLVRLAQGHSEWMARHRKLSHRSTVPGRATVTERINLAGERWRAGAENIVIVHRYQIDGRRFRVLDRSNCKFSNRSGKVLPPHSYASLARQAVGLWMDSPGHRKNILNPQLRKMSSAAAFDPGGRHCGRYYLTQNFMG